MRKMIIFVLFFFGASSAQTTPDLKIGIALRGGGALGFAHIGALSVIDSLGIPIDYIAGTSMGGLMGGLYAIGYSPKEMEKFVLGIDWNDIFNDDPARKFLPYLIKRNSGRYQLALDMDGFSPALPDGLIAGRKIYNLFFSITYPYEGIKSFDDLPIPYRCIGSDLISAKEIVFSSGSLAKAMRATMSIPTVFDPVRYGDSLIIDGGMLNNFPVDAVKNMGADFVIGLDLIHPPRDIDFYDNLLKILDRTMDVPREAKLLQTTEMADLLIDQNIDQFSLADFDKETIPKIITRGKQAAYRNLDKLIALKERLFKGEDKPGRMILGIEVEGNSRISKTQIERILHINKGKVFDENDLKSRIDRFNKATNLTRIEYVRQLDGNEGVLLLIDVWEDRNPVIKDIYFNGNERISDSFLLNFLGIQEGEEINLPKARENIMLLYGLGYFKEIRYQIRQNSDKTIDVLFEIKEKSAQKFLFGMHYDDFFKLVGTIGLRATSVFIPGLYLESDLQFSGLTRFKTDLYYPSRSMEFPIYPILSMGYISIPRDVYDSTGVRALRYDEQGWYFGGGLGLSITKFLNYEGKLLLEYPNIKLDIGNTDNDQREFNDKILSFNNDLDLDLLDNVLIPNNGLKLSVFLELSLKNVGSAYDYVRLSSSFDYYNTFAKNHTARIFARYLHSWKEEPFYKTMFFVGGPKSFIGLNYMQAYGPRFSILRAEYRWQFLQGVYINGIVNTSFNYELGIPGVTVTGKPFWGYGFSLTYSSILGPVEFYFTWGDETPYDPGSNKVLRTYFWAGYSL